MHRSKWLTDQYSPIGMISQCCARASIYHSLKLSMIQYWSSGKNKFDCFLLLLTAIDWRQNDRRENCSEKGRRRKGDRKKLYTLAVNDESNDKSTFPSLNWMLIVALISIRRFFFDSIEALVPVKDDSKAKLLLIVEVFRCNVQYYICDIYICAFNLFASHRKSYTLIETNRWSHINLGW